MKQSGRWLCVVAHAREVKRRMKAGEVPKLERANFFAAGPTAASAPAPPSGSSPSNQQPDDTVTMKHCITHDWDLIEGTIETLDVEYYFVFCQLPWATKKEQLSVVVSEDGESLEISKKKSRTPLKAGALLAAFNADTIGFIVGGTAFLFFSVLFALREQASPHSNEHR